MSVQVNLPAKVRLAIYLLTATGSLVVTYLAAKGLLGDAEIALWAGFSGVISGVAASNVTTEEEYEPRHAESAPEDTPEDVVDGPLV